MFEGLLDGFLGYLVEDDAVCGYVFNSGSLDQVPGDGLAFAVGVGGQIDRRCFLRGFLKLLTMLSCSWVLRTAG